MNLPLYQLEGESPMLDDGCHRGLWYSRFFNQYVGDDWKIPDEGKRQWVSANAGLTGQREVLQAQAAGRSWRSVQNGLAFRDRSGPAASGGERVALASHPGGSLFSRERR